MFIDDLKITRRKDYENEETFRILNLSFTKCSYVSKGYYYVIVFTLFGINLVIKIN